MDLLVRHGTLPILALALGLACAFLLIYPALYPFLMARALDDEDGSRPAPPEEAKTVAPGRRRAGVRVHVLTKSHL